MRMPERVWELAFLEGLRLRGVRQLAADFAQVHLDTVRRHEAKDVAFRLRVLAAVREYRQVEADRRAREVRKLLGGRGAS